MQEYTPEFILVGIALTLLLADSFLKRVPKGAFGIIGALGALATLPFYTPDIYTNLYPVLALAATALTLLLSVDFRAIIERSSNDGQGQEGTGEFFILPLIACAGITAICKATDLISLFVSLEVLTLSSYIMVGYFRRNVGSLEAGVKYLILGAVSTAVLVFGIAWYFGMTSTFNLSPGLFQAASQNGCGTGFLFAFALLLLGTAFKIGAVPMQMWIPDVYQGAPTPATAFLSVASKVAGFAVLAAIMPVFSVTPVASFILGLMAMATLLVGNLGAIAQQNMKRLLGYSSIAQAGFILPFFLTGESGNILEGASNAGVYLAVYLVMTFGAFFALAMVRTQRGSEEISAFRGLGKTNPRLAFAITVMFASLAGVPLTAGFLAKMSSFMYVIKLGESFSLYLLPVMIVCAAAGFYYYFKVIRSMYWEKPLDEDKPLDVPRITAVVMAGCVIFLLVTGIMPLFVSIG